MRQRIAAFASALVVICALGAGCQKPVVQNTNHSVIPVTERGVALTPKSTKADDFTDFWAKAKQAGTLVEWNGDWNDLYKKGGAPAVVIDQTKKNNLNAIIIAMPGHDDLQKNKPQAYSDAVTAFAKKNTPAYLGLGNEINKNLNSSELTTFAKWFPDIVKKIHQASPKTKVFTVWQYEWLNGLRGGLFGGVDDPSLAQWKQLAQFPDADLLAFTTYPGLSYKDPVDVPTDYYTRLSQHTSKPVAFTELGWFREGPEEWASSEAEQAMFITQFRTMTKSLHPRFTIWTFLFDQPDQKLFTTMGLLHDDQTSTPAWRAWVK